MANRFPLIVDSVNLNLKELPSGDNIDLTGNSIYNNGATVVLPTASGTLATLAGTETLTNKTLSSGTLSGTFSGDHTYSGLITLSATSAITIPVGTTAQRPTAATGQIRFNSSLTSFEGYNGTAWSSLGGVKSVDGFTYIIAETSSGASNGELEFYVENSAGTGTTKAGGWNKDQLTVNNNLIVTGNLTVNGTTTTINATTISVDDKNIELGSVATPTDVTADGGGITLKGATDKTITWSTVGWTSSEDFNLVSGKVYEINGTSVLSATTLGSGVTSSSLTSVGTIGTGTWQGTVIAGQYGGTGVNNSGKTITLGGNLTTSGAFATTLTVTGATTVTLPTTGTLATLAGAETLTNKTISGASNTLSNIPNSALSNSTISGVALGSNLNSLTAGTGLSGTAFNGSAAQTWTLAASGVTAGSYGSSTAIPVLTIDSYGRVTAASTSAITVGNGTLTLAVSGTGLSGSASFTANASGNSTFTVTSNATSANTASTIVARDANGDFTAGTVVAEHGVQATSAAPFFMNANTIAANFSIPSNYNAMTAGPITINNNVTVTIPNGSVWTIV